MNGARRFGLYRRAGMRMSLRRMALAGVIVLIASTFGPAGPAAAAPPPPQPRGNGTSTVTVHKSSGKTLSATFEALGGRSGQIDAATSGTCSLSAHVVIDATYTYYLFGLIHTLDGTDTIFDAEGSCPAGEANEMDVSASLLFNDAKVASAPDKNCFTSPDYPACNSETTNGSWQCAGESCAGTYQTIGTVIVGLGTNYAWVDPLPSTCRYLDSSKKTIICSVQSNQVTVAS